MLEFIVMIKNMMKMKKYPKSNIEKIRIFLNWANGFCKKNKLSLNGFWTYDNDFFSWDYLAELVKEKYVVFNKAMGKNQDPKQ